MGEEKKKKIKKINRMGLRAVEEAIEETIKTQGGLNSQYGQALWQRKTELSKKKSKS